MRYTVSLDLMLSLLQFQSVLAQDEVLKQCCFDLQQTYPKTLCRHLQFVILPSRKVEMQWQFWMHYKYPLYCLIWC